MLWKIAICMNDVMITCSKRISSGKFLDHSTQTLCSLNIKLRFNAIYTEPQQKWSDIALPQTTSGAMVYWTIYAQWTHLNSNSVASYLCFK